MILRCQPKLTKISQPILSRYIEKLSGVKFLDCLFTVDCQRQSMDISRDIVKISLNRLMM